MPINTLIEFGLSEKEAKVYIALLEIESAGVNEIAKKAGINRSSTYVVIERLIKKKLVSSSVNKTINTYAAESPDLLIKQTEDRIKQQKNIKDGIEKIISDLKPIRKETWIRPRVYIYSGQEALNKGFSDIFIEQKQKGMKTLRVYQDLSDIYKFMPLNFIQNDSLELKKSGVKMKIICPDNTLSLRAIDEYKKNGSADDFFAIPEKIFRDKSTMGFSSFSVYEDKVECFTPDHFLVVIEQELIANAFKKLFDLAWKEAERLTK